MNKSDNKKQPQQKDVSVIPRAKEIPTHFRDVNEVQAAVRMGGKPHEVKSWYRDIYEFYQNNEY